MCETQAANYPNSVHHFGAGPHALNALNAWRAEKNVPDPPIRLQYVICEIRSI